MAEEIEGGVALNEVNPWRAQLRTFSLWLGRRVRRVEVRRRLQRYLRSVLVGAERRNGWQLAEAMGEETPDGVQRLLTTAQWDTDGMRDDLRSYTVEHFGDPEGVAVIDETGFLKKGVKSAGVKRQYSGTAGRVENSQVGVFLAYASPRGRAFLDRELYLPAEWARDVARREEAHVPEAVRFATKPALARQMLARAFAAGLPIAWVTGDEVYGNNPGLRSWLEAGQHPYVLAVAGTHPVWVAGMDGEPVAGEVRALVTGLPAQGWVRMSAGDGNKGPRLHDWACRQLPRLPEDGMATWALVRRSLRDPTDLAYYRVYGPLGTTLATMVHVAGTRWAIEEGIERAKGEVGLDQYVVRRYDAWYRYITLALLAHAFLEVTRAQTMTAALPDRAAAEKGDLRHAS
jgi:SRSO17 transposase